jgi:hypothetical protein
VRQSQKRVGLFSPSAQSPYLPPSEYRLFGRVKDALRGRHFADDNELKQSFRGLLRSQGREFYSNGVQRLTQRWQKRVKNDGDFAEKLPHNCRGCMSHIFKCHCYYNYIF